MSVPVRAEAFGSRALPTDRAPGRPRRPAEQRPRTRSNAASASPAARTSARRVRHHVGFTVFASVVIGAMVVGLVALNAVLAQTSFRIDDLDAKLADLTDRNTVLTRQVADRSAPGRIADWAARHGMRLPDDIHILLVPGRALGRSDPTGVRNPSSPGEAAP